MKKCLAFVLGSGEARGALQVGALRVLWMVGMLEMVIFTFHLPWADFFRG